MEILLVDDFHDGMEKRIVKFLESRGHRVTVVSSLSGPLAHGGGVDVVILETKMGETAIEVLRGIRESAWGRYVRVVACVWRSDNITSAISALGGEPLVKKRPLELERLAACLESDS